MQLFASVGTWNYILNRESHMQIYVLLYFHAFLFLSFLVNQTAGRISEIVLCISFLSSTKKIKFGFSFYFYYSSFFPLISRQPNDTKIIEPVNLISIRSSLLKPFIFFSISHKDDSSPILFSSPILDISHFSGTDLAGDMAHCTKNLPVEDDVALTPLCTSSPCPATSSSINIQIWIDNIKKNFQIIILIFLWTNLQLDEFLQMNSNVGLWFKFWVFLKTAETCQNRFIHDSSLGCYHPWLVFLI